MKTQLTEKRGSLLNPYIDTNLSEKYGICPYGPSGFEIIRHDRKAKTFDRWIDAVNWAQQNPDVYGRKDDCNCFYCRVVAGK